MSEERKIKIKLKVSGVETEIECLPEDVEETVKNILRSIRSVTDFKEVIAEKEKKVKPLTCKGIIEEIWKEGWFSEPKTLSEVWEEMARRGYNYDRSAVAHA